MMKRLALLLVVALVGVPAWCQLTLADALSVLESGKMVSCSYSGRVTGNAPAVFSGRITLMGRQFIREENGIKTICDGATVWTVDASAKELCIENAGAGLIPDPGRLAPLVKDFRSDGKTLSCTIESEQDGAQIRINASGITVSDPPSEGNPFRFDTSSLDSSWIITDLR